MKKLFTVLAVVINIAATSQSLDKIKQNLFVKSTSNTDDIEVNNVPFYQFNSLAIIKQTKTNKLQVKEYTYRFGESTLSNKLSASMKFDTMGNITEHIIYRENGAIALKTTNKYDKKNRLIENIFLMEGYTVPEKEVDIFNDAKNSKEVFRYGEGKLKFHCNYQYDYKGNEIEYTLFDNSGNTSINNIDTRFKKKYNDFGKMIECTRYYEGKIGGVQGTYKDFYVYDDKNNLIQSGTNGAVDAVYKYEYDLIFVRKIRESNGAKEETQYSNDEHLLLSCISKKFNGESQRYEANVYNDNGLIIGKDFYDSNGKLYKKLKYSYDAFDRINEEIEFNDIQEPVKKAVVIYN